MAVFNRCDILRWRGKGFRPSRRMRNPQFYLSGKRPILGQFICNVTVTTFVNNSHWGNEIVITLATRNQSIIDLEYHIYIYVCVCICICICKCICMCICIGTYNESYTVAVTVRQVDLCCTFLYMSRIYPQWFVNITYYKCKKSRKKYYNMSCFFYWRPTHISLNLSIVCVML